MGESDESIVGPSCPGRQRLPMVVVPLRERDRGSTLRPVRPRTCGACSIWANLAGCNEGAKGVTGGARRECQGMECGPLTP